MLIKADVHDAAHGALAAAGLPVASSACRSRPPASRSGSARSSPSRWATKRRRPPRARREAAGARGATGLRALRAGHGRPAQRRRRAGQDRPAGATAASPPAAVEPPRPAAQAPEEFTMLSEDDLYLFNEGTHLRLFDKLGAHIARHAGATGVAFGVWAPNALAVSVIGSFNGWNPRTHPMRKRGASGIWEVFVPGHRARRAVQVPHHHPPGRRHRRQDRPVRLLHAAPARHGLDRLRPRPLRLGRRRVDGDAAPAPGHRAPDDDLRGARRLVAPRRGRALADLARAGRQPGALRGRDGLHASRADAGVGAPVRRLVGLPDRRLLRADVALRHARRLPRLRRRRAPRRARRDPRLGAGALPQGRATASASSTARISTSTPTRARASTRTGARSSSTTGGPRSGPSCSRTRSTGSSAITSTACGWTPSPRCSTSTTRARKASGSPTATAGARTSRRSSSSSASTSRCTASTSRHAHLRGGVDGLAAGVAAGAPRRARLRPQVEHGVDARHARLPQARPDLPPRSTTTSSRSR